MPDNVAASMTASIVLDKSDLLAQILKGLSEGQKELQNNKLEMYFDFSNSKNQAEFEKVIQKYRKQLSSQEFVVQIKDQGIDETVKSLDKLLEVVRLLASGKAFGTGSGNGKGISNSIVDEKQLQTVINLFEKMESHLGSMRKVISDVGDGNEFSPLLNMINKVDSSISELVKKTSSLSLNMNLDFGSDDKMTAEVQSRTAKLLHTYENLFNRLKMSGTLDSNMQGYFDNFDINQYDNMNAKIAAYKNFITEMREMSKQQFGKDYLYSDIEKSYYSAVSGAQRSLNNAIKSESTSNNSIENLFGKTDLSEVISQLTIIVNKLDEISTSANNFTNVFKNGLDINTSIQEVIDLTNRVKELETELAKIKNVTPATASPASETNISSGNTNPPSPPKKDRYAKRRKISEEDFLNYSPNRVNEKLSNSGYTILGETVNTELVDGLVKVSAKIKDADGAWKSFSAKVDADGNIFEQRFKTVTNGVDKLETTLQNFGRETAPALTYQETLDKAQKIKNSLSLGDEYSIKVDSSEFVTITKKLTDVENTGASVTQTFKSAQDAIDNFGKSASNSAEKTSVALKSVKSNIKEVTDESEKLANAQKEQNANANLNKYDKRLDSYNGKVDKYQATIDRFNDGGWTSKTYLENVQAVRDAVKQYATLLDNIKTNQDGIASDEDIQNLDKYEKKIKDTIATVTNMSASEKGYNFVSGQKELDKIHKLLAENSKMSAEAKTKIKAYYAEIESGNPSMSLDKIHGEILKIYNAEVEAGRAGRTLWDTLKNSRFHQIAAQMAGMFGIYDIINLGKEGFNVVRELNTALTEMRKVSDESLQSLKNYQKQSFDTGDAIATTGLQLQNSTADWQRLGYSISEANELAKNSNIYKNVGDMDISTATEHMVSSVQAWKSEFNDDAVKTSEEVMNRYNKIGNEFAISSADIGEAMETSAAALKAGGNDLNEALGIITAGNIIQQDASTTSSAMKILSLRIRGAKSDLESMGESTDDLADSTSKLREEIKGLTGVDIMADEDTFKSTAEIIKEIGAVWDQMTDVSQAATLEKLAGKNRASTVAGLIENYETIDKVIKAASNADNSALDENQKIIDSIDGKIQKLQNRVQEFWYNAIDDSSVKTAVSILTSLVGTGTKLVDIFGVMPPIIASIFSFIGKDKSQQRFCPSW